MRDGPRPSNPRIHDRRDCPSRVMSGCCVPNGPPSEAPGGSEVRTRGDRISDLVELPAGSFLMGSAESRYPDDCEGPPRPVAVSGFALARHAVRNDDFAAFVAATGYLTTAEREGWSYVFGGLLPDDFPPTHAVVETPWWRQVHGASWRRPKGPQSDLSGLGDHPVVHVSWLDARAYARWAGGRLPSEAEWEFAARGALVGCRFPWGDDLTPGGEHRMNVFQGSFPHHNTAVDGFVGTAPVDAFPPNAYGLWNMTGNVWEWCADRFGPTRPAARNMRGGSYLCHEAYSGATHASE
jgi:formylglycine-generating enzyme